ncbi:protein takeout-like [Schistocerca nitens]|uniref:protein takeout-like n=1 Tax=Schistocerca nitens TaxID=7011 RepID=UPI0021178CA1|nr:protein takeout-like [Schistocerca nitens]
MARAWTLLAVAAAVACAARAAHLPADWKRCSQNDPKFDECLVEAIQDTLPKLKNGVRELDMLPLDPLEITALEIDKGDGPVGIGLKFKNMKIYGISDSIITKHNSDPSRYNLEGDTITPKLTIEADYEADGKVLLLPVKGKGKSKIIMTDLKSHLTHKAVPAQKGGKIYRNETEFIYTMEPAHMEMNFENLLNAGKTIDENMNKFLNENWKEIFAELKPTLETALSRIFLNISRGVFLKVPFDEMFPKK